MSQKEYTSIATRVIGGLEQGGRDEVRRYTQGPSKGRVRWSVESTCTAAFGVLWAFFTATEFCFGIADKNESLLSEAFHSFFHFLGAALSFFCLWYADSRGRDDNSYPYGKQKLNVLAGFVNGLNTMFSAFFVLVKQSHFLLDADHHSDKEDVTTKSFKYEAHLVPLKAVVSLAMLFVLKKYFIYVTHRRSKYSDIKEFYNRELKKWDAKHDNMHSFCLLLFHQGIEKLLIFLLNTLYISLGSYLRDTFVTIFISLLTVWISFPLCTNTFTNLVQGLSVPHAELIERLSKEAASKLEGKAKVVEGQYWQLDMSHIVGNVKIRVGKGDMQSVNEFRNCFEPYLTELTVEAEEINANQ